MDLPDIDEENAKLSNGNDLPDIDEENASVGGELPDIDEVNRSIPPPTWEGGDGGAATLPDGQTNQWGGNLRNEGRKVLFRRDKAGKVNGYSTTSSMLVKHDDGRFAVVPTVVDGKELSPEDAVRHYSETGEHWGMADDEAGARNMAKEVHDVHMKANQEKWNDWVHEHWDEVSDEIRNDRRMDYEHRKRSAPDSVSRLERWAFGDEIPVPDTINDNFDEKHNLSMLIDLDIDDELKLTPSQRSTLKNYVWKRLPTRLREAIAFMAQNRMREIPIEREREERERKAQEEAQGDETGHLENVRNVFVNVPWGIKSGIYGVIGSALGGEIDTNPEYVTERMVDHPLAKKEGETFDSWYERVEEHFNPKKRMQGESKWEYARRRNARPLIKREARKYFDWAAPIAGKEKMQREVRVEKGSSPRDWNRGTKIGNYFLDKASDINEMLEEDYPVGRTGNSVVDWVSGAATGLGKFAILDVAAIPVFMNDAYLNTKSMAVKSGQSFEKAESLATTAGIVDGALTAAFYAAPFKRWFNSKGITPVQRIASGSFSDMSRGMGRYFAKKELLNSGVAALEASGIMGVQGAADTAIAQLAQGQDIDLGEITVGGLKGVRDGVLISAVMGGARIVNARIKGAKEYEKIVRAAVDNPESRVAFVRMNPEGCLELKSFLLEGERVVNEMEGGRAFVASQDGIVSTEPPKLKLTKESWNKFKELCDKAGLPADAKLAQRLLFSPEASQILGDINKFRWDEKTRYRRGTEDTGRQISEKPIIDAETGEVIPPSKALARKIQERFNETPVEFSLPQTPDGKPYFAMMHWTEKSTGKSGTNEISNDPKTGVTIMKNASGGYTVYDDNIGSDDAATLDEAVEKAKQLALMNQYTKLDRDRKEEVIRNEHDKLVNEKGQEDPKGEKQYGKKDIVFFNTMEEAAQAFEKAIARDGSLFGLTDASQLRDEKVQLYDGFVTPDGTPVVIRDNVQDVSDIPRILAHEIVGHERPNGEFGGRMGAQVVFAENIRAKEFEKFKQQIVDGDLDFVKAGSMEDVNRNLGEVFAHYASQNLDSNPSVMNKLVSAVNTAARKLKLRKTYSASDVKVMLKRWRNAVRGDGGQVLDLSDGSPRFDFFPSEPAEAPAKATGEGGEAGTGVEPSPEAEAPAATPAPSEAVHEEPRRMTSAQEVIATAKTPFNEAERAALEAASDVSGIDATDEVPAQGDFLSILSKDAPVVRLNPAKVDRSDSVLPNMKKDANRTSGITKPLSGEWHPTMGGIGAAWLTKDGKLVVITGRHRSELAERKGKSMLYYLYREADGFTKDDALIYDAVANIHDEKGTINDYLGFLDRINPTREQAEKAGILSGKGLVAWSLYKDATEAVRSATAMDGNPGEGQISPQQATVIAQAAPRDADKRNPSIQRQLLRTALGGMRGKAFDMYARIRAEELSKTPVNANLLVGEQMDLFSSPEDQAADILAQRQSQYRTKKAQGYQQVAQNLRSALNKEGKLELTDEYAKDLGVTDKGDKKQLESAYEKAVERANYWENTVRLDDADKAAMDAEINAAADARAKRLADLKAKREAAKSGKPAPKPKTEPPAQKPAEPVKKPEPPPAPEPAKNEPVSAPPTEETTTPPKPEKPVEGRKSSATAAPLTGARGAAAKVFPKGTNEAQINRFVESEFIPLADVKSATLDDGGTLTIVGKSKNGTHKEQRIFKDGSAQGGVVEDGKKPAAPVRESRTTEKSSQVATSRQPSIKMKNEAAEKIAQKQEDDLAALFDTPDLSEENENPAVNGALDHHNENAPRAGSASPQPKVVLNRKAKVSQGTAEIVPQPASEVKRRIQTYRNGDITVRVNDIPTLLRDLGTLFRMRYMGRSRYATYEAQIGDITFRLSDHNASGANFNRDKADKYVSVYIDVQTFPHQATPIPFTEIRFPKESYMRNARGVADAIVDGVESLIDTGDFKVDPSIGQKIEYPAEVSFDTQDFDPDMFQKRVGAVAKLVKTYQDNGVADFNTLATRMAERFPEKFDAMKPYLRGVWNAVADQMGLTDISRGEAEKVYGTIEAKAKEASDENVGRGVRGEVPGEQSAPEGGGPVGLAAGQPTSEGGKRESGGVLAGGPERPESPNERVGGVGAGNVPGQPVGLAETGAPKEQPSGGGAAPGGNGAVADRPEHEGGERAAGTDTPAEGSKPGARVRKSASKAADKTKVNPSSADFTMTPAVEAAILEKKTAQRVRNNLEAIKLIRDLKARDYAATPAEQATLAKFVGWGGLREDVFGYSLEHAYDIERSGDPEGAKRVLRRDGISQSAYDLHKELRQVLNDNEYESAKASSSTAFYTPVEFVRILHGALRGLGVKGGRFLGPSAGTGNFASAAGEYEKPVNWQFVEKDTMTGELLKALFPNQRVTVGGFEETKFPDGFFDFAIDNVPYADVPISDRSLSSRMFKIHDYFFAKTLAKLRPGGVMAFLTSTGTLDKTSPILRQFLTEHGGKIVGAVRLPNGFFAENAGTDAASDLVIVQRVDGRPDNSAFERGEQYGTTTEYVRRKGNVQKPLTYNGYFKDHPEQVIGKMEVASGRFGPTLKFTMPEGGNLWDAVREAVKNAFAGVDSDAMLKSSAVAEPKERAPIYDDEGLRQGNVTMKDGKPFIKSGDMLEPITLPNDRTLSKELAKRLKSPRSIMDGLLGLRKAMRDVIDAQMSDSDIMETDLAPLLAKLNEVYDAFVKKNGTLHDKWITPFVMLDKADGNRLLALERTVKDADGKPKIVKSDIFTKRVISRGQRATKADTPKDALVISYSETGGIDVPRIAELLGVSPDEAVAKLKEGGDAFENPQTGRLEPSWQYLSGRVRAKLAAARAAVEAGEESYRANVEALEKVQPPMVRLEDAEIKFGATWVDTECMKDFLRDAFGSEHMRITLGKNDVTGDWNIEFGRVMNNDAWGETSWDANEFIRRVLNHGSLNAYVTDPVTKKRYLNERQTEANKLAAEKLHSAFSQFIQSSEKWAEPSYERYNAVMTDMVDIKLPNNILPFRAAGMSEDALGKIFEGGDPNKPKKGREYQSAVIARGVLGGNSLCLAHCVGAGKTLEMQSIGILGRHLGLFKKPMYVVPNHMLEQFTNEFMEAFPNANILKMSAEDVKPENRRAFFAQVANGDWDAIVVKHSTFSKKLAMSVEYQKGFIAEKLSDVNTLIESMREAGENVSVDKANKIKARLEEKLEQLINAENKDNEIVPFEELGVDQLFVDEAHNFKGMAITTRQSKIGGLGQGDSQRATDMEMKTQYVQSLHGGERGVVFATGTPLSNAPVVESYVMLKYLAPNRLEEQGLIHFDDFVAAFGRITDEVEFSLDGRTTKEKAKISAFVNIPELMRLFRSAVDIVNPDQLDIPRPKPKYNMIDVDMSPAQEAIMEMVAREAAIPGGRAHPNKFLDLSAIAKMACLTPRLLGYEDGGNKVIRAVSEIKRVYDETSDNRGAQLVFTDIFNESETRGTSVDGYINDSGKAELFDGVLKKRKTPYNLNVEIRDLLIASGIPAEEIAIIQDIDSSKGDKDANKGALFAKVRSGEVRVLIGSRPKMGEGTNVQERLAAIHLLHPGWKPAEDEQAIGRIIRYGNTYKVGQIFYYLTKGNANIGSYETKNHQLVGGKGKLIDQVMHGDETIREIDMDESALNRDMLMGLASGNKALMELIDVKKIVHKMELNTESTMTSARRTKDKAEANARVLERRRSEFEREQEGVAEWHEKNDGKPFALSTPDGRTIEKVKDMADYIGAQMVKQLTQDRYDRSERTVLGDFNGVEMVLTYDKWGDEKFRIVVPLLGVAREINYSGFIPDFSQGTMTAFKGKILETVSPEFAEAYRNELADMDRQAKKMSADADKLQKDYEQMRGELIKMRTREAQLERAVTPLVIQTVADHKQATYGNWVIKKEGGKYNAWRDKDGAVVSAKTVKELIPLMDAEDFASPANSATKTRDLTQLLKPDSKGVYPAVASVPTDKVNFDTPNLSPAEEAYGEAEDKTPTEKVMREVYGMTNEEIATALKAAGMEPPKHVRKPDATAWQQAEALLSNPSYMAKLSRAVAKFPRNIADYENNALNVLFRQRQKAVNDAQSVVDGLKETLDAFDAIPKDERDAEFNAERQKTASDYAEAQTKLSQAKALMYETGLALTRSSSEAGRRLRSNRGLIDQTDYSYAGLSGQVAAILGGADKITPEMDARIREIAKMFEGLDAEQARLATERLVPLAQKIFDQTKNGLKIRKAAERKAGDEAKRVTRNYQSALDQIEVGAAEVGGTLIGLSDQQYPAWGKWLRALGEYHCFENPDITEEECIKAIVEDISPFIDADENQVRDALTGFGHNFRQSRYDSQRLMNDLRSQSRLKRQMDWMDETNTMPPLTGLVRDEPSDVTRNLQKQVQERKKEVPDSGRDERRLKSVLDSAKTRVKNRIADLENAIATGEKIPGRDRTVTEDIELRDLKKRRDELQKEYDELFKTERGLTDEQRVKLAERLLSRELEHALEDLDRARTGDFSKRPKRPGVESPSLDALRERLADVRGQIRELKKAKYEFGMTPEELSAYNARKMANREKALARLAERIVTGDIRTQTKPQPPMPPEMKKQYDELGEQMNRAHRKLADLRREAADARKPKFVRFLGDAYRFIDGVWKMATASLDFTQVGNQTGAILASHPKLVAENFAKTLKAFTSTVNAEAIETDLMSDPAVKEAVDNKWLHWKKVGDASPIGERVELFDAIDRPFTIFGKSLRFTDIPVYGKLIANSDRLYATYINAVSASLYSSIVNDPKLFPGGATVFQKKMICDMINIMNGSGTISKGTRRVLGRILWAPGLVDSQLKRLLGYQIWHPWTASSEEDGSGTFKERAKVSWIGAKEWAKSNIGAILLGGLLFALFATDDQKDEFKRAGLLRKFQMVVAPRIRHTQLDFTGGSIAFMRLADRLVRGEYETSTGKTAQVRDPFGEVAHFAKGRVSPLISNVLSLLSGKDYTGAEFGLTELLMSFAPISISAAAKSIYENGIQDREWLTAIVASTLTMFGVGKGTYRKDDYKLLSNRFLEAAKEYGDIEADELLDEDTRSMLLENMRSGNPLLRDGVREEIAADIARVRKDEARVRRDEKKGFEPDASLLEEIEREKAAIIEKIRAKRK